MTDANIADFSEERRATSLRVQVLVPALILLLAGFAVTFTQTLHEQLGFNSAVVSVFGVLYGVSHIVFMLPATRGTWSVTTLIVAVVSIVMGALAPFMGTTAGLATLILIWASVITLTSVWDWVQTRERDALLVGILAALLAAILALGARELPAVMGFFAGFCIIVGVYLGIASFDRTARSAASEVV